MEGEGEGTHLGFHVVRDVVHGASEGDFTDRPGGIVGEVGGQDADPQLPLVGTRGTHLHAVKYKCGSRSSKLPKSLKLF